MVEPFFGSKKTPFGDSPDLKQLFPSLAWHQAKVRLRFLADHHHGAGLLTGEVGSGKSTPARTFTATFNPNLYKVIYIQWTYGSTLDLFRQLALRDLEPTHHRGDLMRQISSAIRRLNQSKSSTPFSSATKPTGCPIRCSKSFIRCGHNGSTWQRRAETFNRGRSLRHA
jgi:type II secretory pathway predicted ATPase ExeA